MNKLKEIAKSWAAAMNPTRKQTEIADHRISVCESCDLKKYNDILNFYYCGSCGCPLHAKIYSPVEKSCPENKWEI
jgi:hypothetical protein